MEHFPKFLFRTPYVLYGKRVVHFEKWTGGGKSTLIARLFLGGGAGRRAGARGRDRVDRVRTLLLIPCAHKLFII